METAAYQYQHCEADPLALVHEPHAVECDRQRHIISDRGETLEVISKGHEEQEAQSEVHALFSDRGDEKSHCNESVDREYQQEIFTARDPVDESRQQIESPLGGYARISNILIGIESVHELHVSTVVIAHVDPACRYRKKDHEYAQQTQPLKEHSPVKRCPVQTQAHAFLIRCGILIHTAAHISQYDSYDCHTYVQYHCVISLIPRFISLYASENPISSYMYL